MYDDGDDDRPFYQLLVLVGKRGHTHDDDDDDDNDDNDDNEDNDDNDDDDDVPHMQGWPLIFDRTPITSHPMHPTID